MNIKQLYLSLTWPLKKNRALKGCVRLFLVFVFFAVMAPFLANDRPLIFKYKGNWLFPAFSFKHQQAISVAETLNYDMGNEWKVLKSDFRLFALCAYSPHTIDAVNAPRKSPLDEQYFIFNSNTLALPFQFRHWLGTTQNGTDVLSGIIHGTRIALGVGILSMLIASCIGISLGAFAGYFENTELKIGYAQCLFLMIGVFLTYFYCIVIKGDKLIEAINEGGLWLILRLLFLGYVSLKTIGGFAWIGYYIDKKIHTERKLNFPVETIVSRLIEVLNSIPSFLLIIAISALAKPSYSLLILIIGFLSWTNIARLTRAEFLKTKQLDYITSAKAIGMGHLKIMRKQILPNVFPVLLVQIIFGMAGAVLIEASLSFIGIGVPSNSVSWGSLLNEARDHFSAWWLVLFPGLCLFTLIFIYNRIATEISKTKNSS
jgi:peptide/nickel transport system permease protein